MMKRLLLAATISTLLLCGAVSVSAAVYTYQPSPADMEDLHHYTAYTWGIEWQYTEQITHAELTLKNIWDWQVEKDSLWIHMLDLDREDIGFNKYIDNYWGDYFEGQGTLIGVWSDPVGGGPGVNLTFTFDQEMLDHLNRQAATGVLGFGFDPDCHYFNDGIELTVSTTPIPEPTTMILFGLGALGIGLHRRMKK